MVNIKSPNSKDIPAIDIAKNEVPVPVPQKRGRLMKNGAFANKNVANLASSDEENEEALPLKQMELDDKAPLTFTRSKKKRRSSLSNDETDDEDAIDDAYGIDLEDSENCSQESTNEEDEEYDLDDFIDDEDATSVDESETDESDDEDEDATSADETKTCLARVLELVSFCFPIVSCKTSHTCFLSMTGKRLHLELDVNVSQVVVVMVMSYLVHYSTKATASIESQILAAFSPMDVDPVFNPTVPDLEPEFNDTMIGVKQSSTSISNPIHVDLNKEKRKALSNKDVRTRQTGKKGKNNSANFKESSTHLTIAPNRVTFGTLHNIINTNGAPNSLPLQTTSPQNLSTNKENITPLQTPRSYGSTSLGTNVSVDQATQKRKEYQRLYYQQRKQKKVAEANANMEPQTPVGATQYLSGLTRDTNIDDRQGSSVLLPLFDQYYTQTMDDPTIQKRKQYDKARYQRLKEKKIVDADANMEADTMEGMEQNLSNFTRGTNIGDRHGSTVLLPLIDQDYSQTMDGTTVGVDTTIQKRKQYDKSRYQRLNEKKMADANANMEPHTMEGMTQNHSDFTRETNMDDRPGSSILLPLFDQEYSQTTDGNDVGVDPTIQKRKQYEKARYQRRKEKQRADANANMEAHTTEGMTKNLSELTRETNIYDPYDFVYDGLPKEHRALKGQPPCVKCGAKKIQYEFPTFCCMNGKTTLKALEIPPELYNLFTSQCGGIYHRMDQLVPRDGQPRYLQLYFYDAESELEHRLQWHNLDKEIVKILSRVLAQNPYVQTFRTLGNLGPLDKYRVELNASVKVDQRLYNRRTTSEV
ncbi:hypothetical protein CTI12_AA226560 [Artemisia annua]|uniref:Helitron helicase-like domain-containing protein n=1 Tax=Artemisia annua TaxID=35608 RepID=A0A2U1NUR7_ARTAN|nr:hypothetical protein CTI12_AA226560 [Artemisia annua]